MADVFIDVMDEVNLQEQLPAVMARIVPTSYYRRSLGKTYENQLTDVRSMLLKRKHVLNEDLYAWLADKSCLQDSIFGNACTAHLELLKTKDEIRQSVTQNKENAVQAALNLANACNAAVATSHQDQATLLQQNFSRKRKQIHNNEENELDEAPLLHDLRCPICHELMVDAVIEMSGASYCQPCILSWLAKKSVSPLTRASLSVEQLRPNYAVRNTIEKLKVGQASTSAKTDDNCTISSFIGWVRNVVARFS